MFINDSEVHTCVLYKVRRLILFMNEWLIRNKRMNKTLDKNYDDIFINALNYMKCNFNEARSFSDRT